MYKPNLLITTKRCYLRCFKPSDAQQMYENWATDADVTKYLTWSPHANIQVTQDLINGWIQEGKEQETFYQLVIELKDTHELIGSLTCFNNNYIGYCLSKNYWNQGLATEVVQAFLEYLFVYIKKQTITGICDKENIYSAKVMQKCGMHFIKQTQETNKSDEPVVMLMFRITQEQYLKDTTRPKITISGWK